MKRLITIIFSTALLAVGFDASAQLFSADSLAHKFSTFSTWCSPEKLYVHMDRTYFAADETIWFNGYLVNASPLSKYAPGNFIYAELLDAGGNPVVRVKVKRDGTTFPGHMYIPETLATGYYTFRAYTLWQVNADASYMFNQKVKVLGAAKFKDETPAPVKDIDISFYPEGGRYFAGMKAIIGFKVMDSNGRSVDTNALLVDEKDEAVMPVTTVHDGMGRISFIPLGGKSYSVRLEDGRKFPLPAPSTEGASVGVRNNGEKLLVSVSGVAGGQYILLARNSEEFAPVAELSLDGKTKSFVMERDFFPSGINHFILIDKNAHVVSERLFFIQDRNMPVCTLTSSNKVPRPHGLIKSSLTLTDRDGNPLDGECSVSIVRGSFKHHQQDDGLVSYLRLSSELKGHINNPYYYFDPAVSERERINNMDILMMIQGWRYYDIEQMVSPSSMPFKLDFLKEYAQSVKGYITEASAKKMPKNFIFSVLVPRYKFNRFVDVAQANYFTIDSLDFEENTHFLISVTRGGLRRDYAPKWAGDRFAPSFKYFPAPGKAHAQIETEKVPLVSELVQVDTLKAAVVSSSRSDAFDQYMSVGQGVSQDDFRKYANLTLIEYLVLRTPVFEFDGENMYNKTMRRNSGEETEPEEGSQTPAVDGEPDGIVKLFVDDVESVWWTYELVPMEELKSINISTMAESGYGAPNGMVAITLKEGASLGSAEKRDNYIYFVPLGYQKAAAFYSPRYDLGDKHEIFDHRNTVFWAPSVKVTGGKAELDFCNTDQMDYPYIVHMEGLTKNGVPFSGRSILDFKEPAY